MPDQSSIANFEVIPQEPYSIGGKRFSKPRSTQSIPNVNSKLRVRARRIYEQCREGLYGDDVFHLTLKDRIGDGITLRSDLWSRMEIRIGQRWPNAECWTVYEWDEFIGTHLHVLIRGAFGLDQAWVDHITGLVHWSLESFVTAVNPTDADYDRVARYVTKQLYNADIVRSWPRNFHITSASRGWNR